MIIAALILGACTPASTPTSLPAAPATDVPVADPTEVQEEVSPVPVVEEEPASLWMQDYIMQVPPIMMKEPYFQIFGQSQVAVPYTYENAVKLAGHSCGAVAGAWTIARKALEVLYPKGGEIPVRDQIAVEAPGAEDEWFIGVFGGVITYVTGAAPKTGFIGAEFGEANNLFVRQNKMVYLDAPSGKQPPQLEWIFTRLDNGAKVGVSFNLAVIGTFVLGLRHIMPGEASRGGSFDSFCVFGGIKTLLPYFFTGHLLKSTNLLNFSVLIATLGVALVAGRAFCGWLCGLGAIQDFVAGWTRKLLGEKRHIRGKPGKSILPVRLPPSIDRPFRYAKYLVLAVILVTSLTTVFPPLREFCPVRAVFSLKMTSLLWFTLALFLAGSIIVERFWCKYLCPLGAALAIFNKISPVRIVSDNNHCNNCGRCDIECSMGIEDVPHNLDHPECVRCMECLNTCTRDGSLELTVIKP